MDKTQNGTGKQFTLTNNVSATWLASAGICSWFVSGWRYWFIAFLLLSPLFCLSFENASEPLK